MQPEAASMSNGNVKLAFLNAGPPLLTKLPYALKKKSRHIRENHMRFYMLAFLAFLLSACMETGPQKTLNDLAQAMEKNNGSAFLSNINMPLFAENHIHNLARNDEALDFINTLGRMFGIGSLDGFIGNVVEMQSRLAEEYGSGVSTGRLKRDCESASSPDCPWVPAALRDAEITELSPLAAIAKVVTPAGATSWLALNKQGDKWLVVGQADIESMARAYALAGSNQGR